jgi:hypothetical protein
VTYRIEVRLKGGYGQEFIGMFAPVVLPDTGSLTIAYDGGSTSYNRDFVVSVENEVETPEPIVLTVHVPVAAPVRWWNPWSWEWEHP